MTVFPFAPFCLILWLATIIPSLGQDQQNPAELDPEDIYFQAWMAVEDAVEFRDAKEYQKAFDAAGSAKRYLDTVTLYHPTWKPDFVKNKRTQTDAALEELAPLLPKPSATQGPKLLNSAPTPNASASRALTPAEILQASRIQRDLVQTQKSLAEMSQLRTAEVTRLQRKVGELERERNKLAASTLQTQVQKLRNHIDLVEEEKKVLATNLYQTQTELAETKRTLEAQVNDLTSKEKAARQVANELNAMLEKQNTVSGEVIKGLRSQLKSSQKELKETRKALLAESTRSERLERLLTDARGELESLSSERDQLLKERDELSDLLQLNQGDRIQRLIEQNMTLARDLRESQERVDALNANADGNAGELAKAMRDLAMAKSQIMELRQSSDSEMQRRINLERRMADMHAELKTRENLADVDSDLREENKMLREMAEDFLIKAKRQREQAALLIDAAKKRAEEDPNYENALQQIIGEELVLTEEQRTLIQAAPVDGQFRFDADRASPEERELAGIKLRRYTNALTTAIERAYSRGKTEVALDLCEQLLDSNPAHVPTMVNEGIIRLRMGKPKQALTSFNNAVAMQGTVRLPYLHYLLGVTHHSLDQLKEAAAEYEVAVALQPGNAEAHNRLGIVHAMSDELGQAREHFELASRIDTQSLEPLENLVRLHQEQGEMEAALNSYRLYLKAGGTPRPEIEAVIVQTDGSGDHEASPGEESAEEASPPTPEKNESASGSLPVLTE